MLAWVETREISIKFMCLERGRTIYPCASALYLAVLVDSSIVIFVAFFFARRRRPRQSGRWIVTGKSPAATRRAPMSTVKPRRLRRRRATRRTSQPLLRAKRNDFAYRSIEAFQVPARAANARKLMAVAVAAAAAAMLLLAWVLAGADNIQNEGQKSVVDVHNGVRAEVGVAPLAWDDTVAAYAQRYAGERKGDCKLVHSGGPYGKNIFLAAGGTSWPAAEAVEYWAEEKRNYNCSDNSCTGGRACRHYTQMVWANTTRVGCAATACDGGGGTFIVCEYDPPGNFVGVRPYAGCGLSNGSDKGNGTNSKGNSTSSNADSSSLSRKGTSPAILPIVLPVVTALGLISAISICVWRKRTRPEKPVVSYTACSEDTEDIKSVLLDPSVIRVATGNFAEENKLGEGGFGQVYKGLMPDGQQIAVKRLAKESKQGIRELKNELLLVAKLQHRNLVKLIGACLDGEEKLLVYEYIPKKSLDVFIFDDERREQLAWDTRYKIICGIARGLVYLHDESRVKVIHRDLKPSNILLEFDMNPKISDFGLASVFEDDHTKHITRRVAGTYGYMAPEYAVLGHVSTKSDVFSFGVIILEILTGRRNSISSETMMTEHLLSYVWENWTRGTKIKIVDPSLRYNCAESEVLKCIHIGLLCVQEDPSDRPSMSNVTLMLAGRSTTLPASSRPAFLFRLNDENHGAYNLPDGSNKSNPSVNKVTITEFESR